MKPETTRPMGRKDVLNFLQEFGAHVMTDLHTKSVLACIMVTTMRLALHKKNYHQTMGALLHFWKTS